MLKYPVLREYFKRPFVHLILIVAVGLIIYSNTFNVPFQMDEKMTIMKNPIVKDFGYFLNPSKAKGLGVHYINLKDRYMGYLSFAVNYRLHGLDVRGYHVLNLILHILNAFFLYIFVRLTFLTPFLVNSSIKKQSKYIALFTGLIFVTHPIQTEAVNYIMGRLPLLVSFFYLSSIVLYVKWRLTPPSSPLKLGGDRGGLLYILSLLSAVLAMKTKENAFTLPFAIALYEFFFFNATPIKRRMLYLLPFMLTLSIIPVTRMFTPENDTVSMYSLTTHVSLVPPINYLFTQIRVLVTYLRLLAFPINQNFLYDQPVYNSFFDFPVMASFIFLLVVFLFGIYMYVLSRGKPGLRIVAFGVFWFFLTMSVESSIFPIYIIICEYRLYLPSAGIFIAVLTGIGLLMDKYGKGHSRAAFLIIFFLVPVVLATASYKRNDMWRSKVSLWEDVVKKSPNSALAHFNLGNSYKGKAMFDEAIKEYQKVLVLNPFYDRIFFSIGTSYLAKAQYEAAMSFLKREIEIDFSNGDAHLNLGYAYMKVNDLEKARQELEIGLKMEPANKKAREYLDNINRQIEISH